VWDKVGGRVQALLTASAQWTGGKQRLTATRLHGLVVAEGHQVGVTVIKAAMAEWKRQRREFFVPLTYRPGDLAEVDFFEVLVDVDGTRRKAWLFLMRLMYSGRDFAWIYERQDQISFLDGHVRAFAHFDGVPARVAYDNLRAAVVRILVGGARTLTPRFSALASHYLLEACFCRPGEGHDKGGVEARGKAVRQQALVPIPVGPTLASINAALLTGMDARLETQCDAAGQTIGARFTEEQRLFRLGPDLRHARPGHLHRHGQSPLRHPDPERNTARRRLSGPHVGTLAHDDLPACDRAEECPAIGDPVGTRDRPLGPGR
jgi:transposase